MRVLVADDDLGSRLVAQAAVRAQGHECITAADGDEAWELLSRCRPDVLVTDRNMPGIDGLDLCRRLRDTERDSYTYVVLLTGLADPDEVTAGMQAGADDYLTKPLDPFALQTRLLAASRVTALHTELAQARAALVLQASTDPLTGLRNRLGLTEYLEQQHAVSQRYDRAYCVALGDVDHFKSYNDTYGHPAGDQVLRQLAGALLGCVRDVDGVFRYGGEEFLLVFPEQEADGAIVAVRRLLERIRALGLEHSGGTAAGVVTMSFGIATCAPGRRLSSEAMIAEADEALYAAKATGRDRLVVAGAEPDPDPDLRSGGRISRS